LTESENYGYLKGAIMKKIAVWLLIPLLVVTLYAQTEEPTEKIEEPPVKIPEDAWGKTSINVIGEKKDSIKRIPGSATILNKKYLQETRPIDNMEALRAVPGASIRYQDPAGLTMNLGFRGVSNEVSRKVLILEDGLPVSLNPYGEPEMYYTPSIDRMERIEVVKGSGSILFGPSTIGGVVNFISKRPSQIPKFYTTTIGGENGYFSTFTGYGGTFGNTGIDVSILRKQGDGFRNSQSFKLNEINVKTTTELNEKNTITTKFGFHEQQSQATYLGLTTGMFNGYPTKRTIYNANNAKVDNPLTALGVYNYKGAKQNPAEQDKRVIERWSGSIGHEWKFIENWKLITNIYGYGTKRDWSRQEYSRNTAVGQTPPNTSMMLYDSEPFTDRVGDSVWMRNTNAHRNRDYLVGGIEARVQGDFSTGDIKHELDLGARYHYDRAKVSLLNGPDTPDYAVPVNDGKAYTLYSSPYSLAKSGVVRDDEQREAKAVSGWFQDRISLTKQLAIIPGVRYEAINQYRQIRRRQTNFNEVTYSLSGNATAQLDTEGKSSTHVVLPGFGATFEILENFVWFAGVHRGFAPPRYESAISPTASDVSLKAEKSWNYESGVRGDITKYFYTQVTGYLLDFQDQIVNSSAAGGNLGSRPVNAGKSIHRGAELTLSLDFGKMFDRSYSLVLETNSSYNDARSNQYTYNLDALQKNNPDPLLQKDTNGNLLPYVSRDVHAVGLSIGLLSGFYSRVEYQHFSKQYHNLANTQTVYWYDSANGDTKKLLDYLNIASDASGTTGVIPAFGLVHASLGYKDPDKKWSVFIHGKNLQNKNYISTRLPEGIQPGPLRQINVGFSMEL
jgi:Fe(3+) dicitrate transport protein